MFWLFPHYFLCMRNILWEGLMSIERVNWQFIAQLVVTCSFIWIWLSVSGESADCSGCVLVSFSFSALHKFSAKRKENLKRMWMYVIYLHKLCPQRCWHAACLAWQEWGMTDVDDPPKAYQQVRGSFKSRKSHLYSAVETDTPKLWQFRYWVVVKSCS
jgi:hypothetical protein